MRKRKTDSGSWTLLALLTGILLLSMPLVAEAASDLTMAPVNPAFTDYLLHVPMKQGGDPSSKGMGYIPAPIDRSHLKGMKQPRVLQPLTSLPASFDLRTTGKVTPVRDQGACGSCWSFGALASLESALLTGETRDFSENNLKNNHGYDWTPCQGGNIFLSTGYLMRWGGPVNETDDPYQQNENPSPTGLTVQKHSQNIIQLPPRASSTDNDVIKNALVTYGAVTMAYYHSNSYYNSTYRTYYYNGSINSNHEVAIVGWDDNFDKTKFSPNTPAGNGAFIVKNSWGTSWGESGYFYISYYDTQMGYNDLAVFTSPEKTTNYSRMYSYDPLSVVSNFGYGTTPTAWFANIFTAQGNDRISAVSFYNSSLNSPYEIYVYKDLTNATNPRSGTLVSTNTGTLADSGYLTLPLTSPATVISGHTFSVVVKLTTPGYNYPIPTEFAYPGYSSAATASPGQSFYSSSGSSWTDITSYDSTMNVCLKAYTSGKRISADFDGDGKTDTAVWRATEGKWYIIDSSTGSQRGVSWGASSDVPVPGDYDGDGKTDIAVWRPTDGKWYITDSSTGSQRGISWGASSDTPVPGDYDGDGKTDTAVWRPSEGKWYIIDSSTGSQRGISWGASSDIPVPGDYDGDGKTDTAVWRPSEGKWYIIDSSTGSQRGISWGASSDVPVLGDYDGDGKTDTAVWRPSEGKWYIIDSSTGSQRGVSWGAGGDIPVPGDYDGDGKTDTAVWRPTDGKWYIIDSSTGSQRGIQWGSAADQPIREDQPIN